MPLFISKQAERDYYTLRRTMDLAQFKNDRPLIDWCERYLAPFRHRAVLLRRTVLPI